MAVSLPQGVLCFLSHSIREGRKERKEGEREGEEKEQRKMDGARRVLKVCLVQPFVLKMSKLVR